MTNPSNFRYPTSASDRVTPLQSRSTQLKAPADELSLAIALTAARAADERKGENIVLIRVEEVSYLADYFVIVSGFSGVQVRAISNAILDAVSERCDRQPIRLQGQQEGNWILQDYGDVVVHILQPQEREFYNLEAFWSHGEQIAWDPLALSQESS